jgi:outer membrane protein OmpA-like peptidoglycan-associated protein
MRVQSGVAGERLRALHLHSRLAALQRGTASMNLLELVEAQLTDEVLGSLGGALGESRDATRRVLTRGAVPAIVAGLGHAFAGEAGAARLLDLLRAGGHDGGLLGRLPVAVGGGAQTDALVAQGRGLSGQLLGGHEDRVIALLATASGVRRTSAATMLSLALPIVLATLGRPPLPTASALASQLRGARVPLDDLAEPGLAVAMGLSSLAVEPPAAERKPPFWQWLVVPAVTLVVFFSLRSCQHRSEHEAASMPAATSAEVTAPSTPRVMADETLTGPAAPAAAGPNMATPGSESLEAATTSSAATASIATPAPTPAPAPSAAAGPASSPAPAQAVATPTALPTMNSSAAELSAFLADAQQAAPRSFVLRGVSFDPSTPNLKPASLAALDEVARVLVAAPHATAEVRGHTDSSGNAETNRSLSAKRANAVLERLVAQGVARERLVAAGLGATIPIAPNDTIEGRGINRRIELAITAR